MKNSYRTQSKIFIVGHFERYLGVFALMILLSFSLCHSQTLQWREIGQPLAEGQGFPFSNDPTKMVEVGEGFVLIWSSAAGMVRYDPADDSWSQANSGLGTDTVVYLTNNRSKDTALCIDNMGKVFISVDLGLSWNYFMDAPIAGMYIEHAGSGVYLAWSRDDGVYQTNDSGQNWSQVYNRSGFDHQMIVSALGPETYLVGTEENGIYRTTNSGNSWDHVYTITVHVQTFSIDDEGSVYAGTKFGIALSIDNGANWSKVSMPGDVVHEAFNVSVSEQGIFIPYSEDLYYSSDNGESWENLNETNIPNVWDVLATTEGQVFVRSRHYNLWLNDSTIRTYSPSLINVDRVNRSLPTAVTSYGNTLYIPGLYCSANNGREYRFFRYIMSNKKNGEEYKDILQTEDGAIWLCTRDNLYVSQDSARSFELIKGKGNSMGYSDLAVSSPQYLLLSSFDSLYFTTNGGAAWTISGVDPMTALFSTYVSKNGTPFFATLLQKVYRSPDGGKTWELVLEGDYGEYSQDPITLGPDGKIYCGTYTSSDDGLTWQETPNMNLPPINKWYFDKTGRTWVATEGGLFWKSDTSLFWNRCGMDRDITAFHRMDDGWFVVSSNRHLYVSEGFADPTPVESTDDPIPARISMDAYPNPFVSTVSITVTANNRAHIGISIYNTLGHSVATLTDAEFNPGTYTLNWNGRTNEGMPLPPGSYYVRMATPDGVQSMRVLKVR